MRVHEQEFEHPTQASRVRLSVYEYEPSREEPVKGLGPREPGFMVTEERAGAVTVVSSLGFFPTRDQAMARVRSRAEQLQAQRYRSLVSAA